MRRITLLLVAFAGLCLPATAQNFVTITASNIQDSKGTKLAVGQLSFLPTNNQGQPIGFKAGGGGQTIAKAVTCSVTNGVIAAGCQLAATDRTNILNVCFKTTLKNPLTNEVVIGSNGSVNSGYDCLQPVSSDTTSNWCAAGVCNFDNYVPAGTPGVVSVAGAQGPPGPATVAIGTTSTGAAGSSAAVTNSGTGGNAVLNFQIPRGADGTIGVNGTTGATGPAGPTGPTGATGPAGSGALPAGVTGDGDSGLLVTKKITASTLAVGTTVSSPQYCIGASCITGWPSPGSGVVAKTCTSTDKFNAVDASGNFTCTADAGGGAGVTVHSALTGLDYAASGHTGFQPALGFTPANTTDARFSDARTPLVHNQAFSTITATPTTLAGYGISDGATSASVTAETSRATTAEGVNATAISGKAANDASTTVNGIPCTLGSTCTISTGGGSPWGIGNSFAGIPPSAYLFLDVIIATFSPAITITIPASCTGSAYVGTTNTTGSTQAFCTKNGTTICTATVAAGAMTATWSGTGGTLTSGDRFKCSAATADATFSNPAISIAGSR